MKVLYIIGFLAAFVFSQKTNAQTINDFSITTMDGQQHSLNEYAGKKMLLVVLPVTQTSADSSLLKTMDTLSIKYADSITIIGIPSYEDGFYDDSLLSLKTFYSSVMTGQCVIAEGVSTRKTSAYQDPMFAWLTHKDQNGHFDEDVKGTGELFFIDTAGNLYGVFGPEQMLNDALMQKMLNGN